MKYALLICFLLYTVNSQLLGGWKKGSFRENDFGIDRAFKKAFQLYKENNPTAVIDSLKRLTVYRQTANGINYLICFIDLNSKLNVVQEYIISGPAFNNRKDKEYKLFEHKTYPPKIGYISVKGNILNNIKSTLSNFTKNSNDVISKIDYIDTYLDNFYIVTTRTGNDRHTYVVSQSKENTEEYETLGKLK